MLNKFNKAITNQPEYKISHLQEKASELIRSGIELINATIGDPKDATPIQVQTECINAIKEKDFSQYPKHTGKNELKEAIKNWASREYNCQLDSEHHIISCNGTKEAIFSMPLLFDWTKKQHILIPSLSYPVYKMSANYFNVSSIDLKLTEANNFFPILEDIPEWQLKNTQFLWLNSPHNPTSAIASKATIENYLRYAEKYNFFICSDECYNDLYSEDKPTSILEFDSQHWICFRSLSKRSHMTGYRSGAIISKNKTVIDLLKKARSPMGIGTPSFIQNAAIWAWNDHEHIKTHRELYNQKRAKVRDALQQAGLSIFGGDAGFYIWAKSAKCNSSDQLANWFLEKDILVTPGTVFGEDGNPYIRLVFCLKDIELNKLIERIVS